MEKIWPQMRELNSEIFVSNVISTYLVSALEDYFKSTYIALLTYSDGKGLILKNIRLSGDHLSRISEGTLTVEEAAAETLPFQRLAVIGRNFTDIDRKLDVLAPLKRPYRRRKMSLLDSLEYLITRRHALIHGMQLDIDLDRDKLKAVTHDLTTGISRVYQEITSHFGWPFELPVSSNFILGPRQKPRAASPSEAEEVSVTSEPVDDIESAKSVDAAEYP